MEKTGLAYKLLGFFTALSGASAYGIILGILLACGLGLPIPEDITLIAAGILAGTGKISLTGAYIVGFVGVLLGDTFLFCLGRKYGRAVFEWKIFRKIFTEKVIKIAEEKIQGNAKKICFIARFLPGLRAPIYLSAGVLRVKPSTFIIQDSIAALISVPIWIALGHWAGDNMDLAIQKAQEFHIYLLSAVAIFFAVWFISYYLKKKKLKPNNLK